MTDSNWRHEEQLVRWLLEHYDLNKGRLRFMLEDDAELLGPVMDDRMRVSDYQPPVRRLRFAAFDRFFQTAYPIRLEFQSISDREAKCVKAHKLLTSLDTTRLFRDFEFAKSAGSNRAHGIVYHWPYERDVGKSIVVHNALPVDPRVPGTHLVWTSADGEMVVIEALETMLRSLDARHKPNEWQSAAVRTDFLIS